ncbi:SMI1/KNR4 family protein [Porphyromonas sp. oral taxon 275]|uniref:SMI1/KNR4 family protein n=1 Tax=Porphyromonas sp. oral taxon 275 TaxID=712435 RepID=UPI001BA54175|nr:SMI1/KNR4 family protein [Porphyromonas sp. oral taxon 275]QUB42349.1 SMI1/KNR4 family protein [Porphyromonas sp. oral taxon 275]
MKERMQFSYSINLLMEEYSRMEHFYIETPFLMLKKRLQHAGHWLFFRVSELEIPSRLISLTKSSRDKEAYLLSFANDSSGNIYCIEEGSGKVFYIHHEEEECVTEVAPSFLLFCENIKGEMR